MEEKVQSIIAMIRGDIIRAKQCKEYNDMRGAEYNEGLARGRLSALFNLGLIDETSKNYYIEWIDEEL